MSTRALYTFIGADGEQNWNVYKHSDGYPTGAAETLETAQAWFAWKAPRYESDEFAAAFIAAGKAWALVDKDGLQSQERWGKYAPGGDYNSMGGGGVRLMPQGEPNEVAKRECCDIAYRYEIYPQTVRGKMELRIKAFEGNWWESSSHPMPVAETCIIDCPLSDFPGEAEKFENKEA